MSARVLVVDDEDGPRITIAAVLEDAGYAVDGASSLAEARELLAGGARFDVALLDYELDDGTGPELVPELRAGHATRVVVMSGREDVPLNVHVEGRVLKGSPVGLLLALVAKLAEAG